VCGDKGVVKGASVFFLLNIMIHNSPACSIKKKVLWDTGSQYPTFLVS
jgi:hypothetical protein